MSQRDIWHESTEDRRMAEFEYTPQIIRKLQMIELDMLREADRICRQGAAGQKQVFFTDI